MTPAAPVLAALDPNLLWVAVGAGLLGLAGGVLGTFALLRRQALLGDALAHAALPGVCVAFLLTLSKDPLVLLVGALCSGGLGTLLIGWITRLSRIKEDAAIGIVLSVFFALGILLLTRIQRMPSGNQAGLDHMLFGQAASLLKRDLQVMATLTAGLGLTVLLLYKELLVVTFDGAYAQAIGIPARRVRFLLTTLIVLACVLGLQAVGIVLMAALLVTPPAAARLWTDSLPRTLIIAGAFGALSGLAGALISSSLPRVPTGPVTVLVATVLFAGSLALAPEKGLVARLWRRSRSRARVRRENVLKTLYLLDEGRAGAAAGGRAEDVAARRGGAAVAPIARELSRLQGAGLVEPVGAAASFQLTADGRREAERLVRSHRLWELYLVHQADIATDHVHRDADTIEHLLPPELVQALDERLQRPDADPHGRPIPRPASRSEPGEARP